MVGDLPAPACKPLGKANENVGSPKVGVDTVRIELLLLTQRHVVLDGYGFGPVDEVLRGTATDALDPYFPDTVDLRLAFP